MNTRGMQRLVKPSSLTWQWGEHLHFCWCNWPRHWRTGWSTARRALLEWSWNREIRHTPTTAWDLAVMQSRWRQCREPDGRRTGAGRALGPGLDALHQRLRTSGAGQVSSSLILSFLIHERWIATSLRGLGQWSLTFMAPGTVSWKTIFLRTGVGDGFGMIQAHYIYCTRHFYYYYISSTSDHQALDPGGWDRWVKVRMELNLVLNL